MRSFRFLAHLGRHLRDFLLNLDNFHDYLKFTFPRMKAPSFFVEEETDSSMEIFHSLIVFMYLLRLKIAIQKQEERISILCPGSGMKIN